MSSTARTLPHRPTVGPMLGVVIAGLIACPPLLADARQPEAPARPRTNVEDALKVPRTKGSLPGLFPGKVVKVHDEKATLNRAPDARVVKRMVEKGITALTGVDSRQSFRLWFEPGDVIGIKVNPVGAGIISTHLEVVDAVIDWLVSCGMPRARIVIWDRFGNSLKEAGFTPERFPGVSIEGLQVMDEAAQEGKADDRNWLGADGHHVSEGNFDRDVFYFADIEAPKDKPYLNQHVFNGKHSYFGKLVTRKLTKIINVPVFKNAGNAISMATKNLGYGAVCNTGRLHEKLSLNVNAEVFAFPAIRDKLVLNITDGLVGQYDGGPMAAGQFCWAYNTLFFATDAFALDAVCHDLILAKRKEKRVKVNEHPRFTEYLRYAQKLGLGVTDPKRIEVLER